MIVSFVGGIWNVYEGVNASLVGLHNDCRASHGIASYDRVIMHARMVSIGLSSVNNFFKTCVGGHCNDGARVTAEEPSLSAVHNPPFDSQFLVVCWRHNKYVINWIIKY